ncbi:DNA polymerase-3 subunit delta' [Chishuiella changwenlii]|uniref:DNA polymerase III subunit delta n=1 Tax=Chishuiella changwenlii TaxID=1434701 RepID=A0A1M6SY47_9FLAO|nr:DNA polymerase III subunit delta' [Chishuiella changwenlii]GGF08895.1 DNA polymerase III subunit delta' [Chishuiella changwenlii]SHK49662.1 DNA polymerase-3 subunit delta' [Chishuiella changwenlii]
MHWENIIGQKEVKEKLQQSIKDNRISHAQLFSGPEGSATLPLAIAYAREVLSNVNSDQSNLKVDKLQHPDLHFAFPYSATDAVKKPLAKYLLNDWRSFLQENAYGNLTDWMSHLGIAKKQGVIPVDEADEIIKTLALNSYEGGYKIMIIWQPETMTIAAANKLLKIIEEPPQKTLFLLVTEREDLLLQTITSRCQLVKIPKLSQTDINDFLINEKGISPQKAQHVSFLAQGNLREALHQLTDDEHLFDTYFVTWVRKAFMAAKTPTVLKDLIDWSNQIASWSRNEQKDFLNYCAEIFRQALLKTYQTDDLVFLEINAEGFKWQGFAPFINGANIEDILNEINEASYHIDRNGNSKIILLDLSIKLTRNLHKK